MLLTMSSCKFATKIWVFQLDKCLLSSFFGSDQRSRVKQCRHGFWAPGVIPSTWGSVIETFILTVADFNLGRQESKNEDTAKWAGYEIHRQCLRKQKEHINEQKIKGKTAYLCLVAIIGKVGRTLDVLSLFLS